MKKTFFSIVLSLLFIPLFAQEPELGLPGDNLNLNGVLNIFQNSPTLETFEKNLNAKNSQVNNLDLNGDGRTDYIHVIDNMNGSAHAIVLRVDVNETETQDVAVIEVEKDVNNQVHVQIVGDEALYGKDYIVEPNQSSLNPGYGRNATENATYYSPDSWAIIGYMFAPRYIMYNSPYHWGYYPHYWRPWSPLSYHDYYGFHRPYSNNFRRSDTYHSPAAHAYYGPHRVSSAIVRERYHSPRTEQLQRNRHEAPIREQSPRNRQPARINQEPRRTNNQPARINQEPRRTNNQPARVNQTPRSTNNQPARINQAPRPTNNQPSRINQAPRPTNNQPSRINQAPRPTNNQPSRINQAPRPTNNQPSRINQAPRPTNNQPAKINKAPHPTNNQPAKQPIKSNSNKKKEPPKK
jgi:hypothetical protein